MGGDGETLIHAAEAYRIQGAAFEVYRRLGSGFLEAVYQEALAIEFEEQRVPFVAMPSLHLEYRDRELKARYTPDFICFGKIIIELKAARQIAPEHRAQLFNYLRASDLRLGLLMNFGSNHLLEVVRIAL